MTSDNLLKFLGNRAYLHQVSYQELKSLVVQYPYSLSLRYLLAMKSQEIDNTDLDRNVEMLATYGIDRSHYHKIFSEDPIVLEDLEESIIMGENYLELKELSTLEREMETNLISKETSEISFLEEKIPIETSNLENPYPEKTEEVSYSSNEPEASEDDDSMVKKIVATSTILGGASLLNTNNTKDDLPEIEPSLSTILEDKEILSEEFSEPVDSPEEFIEMDFEEDTIEEQGSPTSSNELAPSESISTTKTELTETGLPKDAIEVNDLFQQEKEIELNDLYQEAETELIEEAVSDSDSFIDNPEELLLEESEKVISENSDFSTDSVELTEKIDVTLREEAAEEEEADLVKAKQEIPFEISYSEKEPIPSSDIEETELEALSMLSEDKDILHEQDSILTPTPPVKKVKDTSFRFDSLDQFEDKLNQNKLNKRPTPIPKSGFRSWQEQYSGVGTLSGIDLVPMEKASGKVIKIKKKIVRKQFEKTVAYAEESLTITDGIASETLAQLLVKQGQYSQARAMYKELCLIIPEKSSFFAGEIEKIQNLPDEPS